MRVIYKYELKLTESQTVDLPHQSKVLSVGMQGDKIVMWVEIKNHEDTADDPLLLWTRTIHIFGTGVFLPDEYCGVFLGTLITDPFVWHVYVE